MKHKSLSQPLRVLVIEDEPDVRVALVSYLKIDGLMAHGVGTLEEADHMMNAEPFHVILLDLGLPDGDGIQWLKTRNDLQDMGVIIVTARGDAPSRVAGVRAGADVYLIKPVLPEELVSLIHNLTRRIHGKLSATWSLDVMAWRLTSPEGISIKLTHSERMLLQRMAESPGHTVSREDLAVSLGNNPDHYDYRRLEMMIRRLRQKADEFFKVPFPLETAHGKGYAFTAQINLHLN